MMRRTEGSGRLTPARRCLAMVALLLAMAAGGSLWTALDGLSRPAWGQALVADLSSHLIAITTGFTGTEVVLFGAVDEPGDVAVVVQGPEHDTTVRRKGRVAGLWLNTDSVTFERVPAFYALATSAALDGSVPAVVLQRHEIGLDNIRLMAREETDPTRIALYRTALIRNKQRMGLYGTTTQEVLFLGRRLFRTTIRFPANVPTGLYTAGVYLIQDGDVVNAQITPLSVSKLGFSASVSQFARKQSIQYALLGLALAIAAGWLAGVVFRKP
jgi:uncharacterized protein (TIGR02186 family)